MTDSLNTRQRAQLRALAHGLKPVLHVGKEGVTERAITALVEAFNTRELVKVKVQEGAPETAAETGAALAAAVPGAILAFTIGRTAVVYRRHPEKPEIRLA